MAPASLTGLTGTHLSVILIEPEPTPMGLISKLIARVALNAAVIYGIAYYLPGFQISGGTKGLILAALVVALAHFILRPILKLISFPLLIFTFGFFNIVINFFLLWAADAYSTALTIADLKTLFISSIIIGFINSIF
ncbi:MAG: phage holin family protein [Candidatus Sungbacteria bacterium]|nr:phage holin family protein [Candidatus Sungbacteria bacterium]